MAITPEEFFLESLMEPIPPSPSAFLDLPQTPDDGDGKEKISIEDTTLSSISRVLIEEEIDDNVSFSDQPGLIEVQRPFAEILLSHSVRLDEDISEMYAYVPPQAADRDEKGMSNGLLLWNGDDNRPDSDVAEGFNVVGSFLKGMEEATRLLPKYGEEEPNRLLTKYSSFRRGELVDETSSEIITDKVLRKRCSRNKHPEEEDKVEGGRKAARIMQELEELNKIFNNLMVLDPEACVRDMKTLLDAMENEETRNHGNTVAIRVDLRTLLILCAQAVSGGNYVGASQLLNQIRQHASEKGDATQRLARCFADGLEARLAGTYCQVYKCPSVGKYLEAHKLYMEASGIYKVAFSFNTITILHAVEGKSKLHIVEFGTLYGLQWSYLLHYLAHREGGPPEVRITTINCPRLKSLPTERIEETGLRLSNYAHKVRLPFKFHSITAEWHTIGIEDLNTSADEVLVVTDLFNLSTLMDESTFFDDPSPKEMVLNNISKMCPDVFIQNIVNRSSSTSFLTRFREALFYFTALFDMLDETIPRESEPRLVLEQGLFGQYALNIIACEGEDLMDRPEKYKQWQVRNKRAGLRQVPFKPKHIADLIRDEVMKSYHKDFFLTEDDQWLIHGWMGRVLFAHSTWMASDAPFSK